MELLAQEKTTLQYYEYCTLECIEMATWLLYLKEEWCESNISGQVYTLSFLPEIVTQCPFEIQFEKESSTSTQLLSYIFSQDSRLSAKHVLLQNSK